MALQSAYIISARRTALGRVGGLHKSRRVEDLAAPVVQAVLKDAGLKAERVDEVIVGNCTAGGNPARLIALAAGLPEIVPASTIDQQCGSGLEAILSAIRRVASGDAGVIVAGGAESLSTAPWRIARPKSLYQTPHFIGLEPAGASDIDEQRLYEASEDLARSLGISRMQQDAFALKSHMRAGSAREARRFVGEILPLRAEREEARDQSAVEPDMAALERLTPFVPPDGTLTPGNTRAMHDGAAMVLVVSQSVWSGLGKPPALTLVASAAKGIAPEHEAQAPIAAMKKLYDRLNGFDQSAIRRVEMSESSAAQAIAFCQALDISEDLLNPDGGAIVRGHPLGAAGAVLVTRLFSGLARDKAGSKSPYGVAALGAIGGLGLAALFERA
ncbi:MAG: thiolase family protein [Hyphomicrobiaceae bacterium]